MEFYVVADELRGGLTFVLVGYIPVRPLGSEAPVAGLVPDDLHILAVDREGFGQEQVLGALELDCDRASDRRLAGLRALADQVLAEVEVPDESVGRLGQYQSAILHVRRLARVVLAATAIGVAAAASRLARGRILRSVIAARAAPHREREGHGQHQKRK